MELLGRASPPSRLQVNLLTIHFTSFFNILLQDQLAARLNAKLNYVPGEGGEPLLRPVEEGGVFQKYEEELEINDFPQQARFERIRIQVETNKKVNT